MIGRLHWFCLALFILTGCTVGPNYVRPPVPGSGAAWIRPASPGSVDPAWWRPLGDPVLEDLINTAVARNLDLREAEALLREARANRGAAVGRSLPALSATGSAAETQISRNGALPIASLPGFDRRFSLFDGGFDASWELDLWGGTRRSIEGATGREAAAEARRVDVGLQVIAEVGRTYAALRASQAQLTSIRSDAQARNTLARLVRQRLEAGEASRYDVAQADAQAGSARARVADADADVTDAAYRLALLVGRPPEALLRPLLIAKRIPEPPAIVAAGIRSELLRRRPDVRAAEADLAAATADIGVETANLFPRFSLVGGLAQQARRAGDLSSSGSTRFSIGPSFSWPIFSGGRIRAQIRAADARADAARTRYEKAVLSALSDSETAINRYAAAQETRQDLAAALTEHALGLALARQRFRAGEDDLLTILAVQSLYNAAEQQAIAARKDELSAYIALSKALGGGWKE